jgi:hypothetical protein
MIFVWHHKMLNTGAVVRQKRDSRGSGCDTAPDNHQQTGRSTGAYGAIPWWARPVPAPLSVMICWAAMIWMPRKTKKKMEESVPSAGGSHKKMIPSRQGD